IIEEDSEKLVDMLLAFTDTKLMQAHYPEIMLAWMCAGDPNYTENPFSMKVPESLRVVTINCPVDVEVYDSKGVLVASAKDKVCTVNNGVVGCAVNGDGEIILHLPSDEEYKINIIATGDGEVNVNLGEYNMLHSAVTRVQTYPEIPVKTGDTLVFKAPIVSENEFTDEEQMGSSAEYELFGTDGEKVAPETEKRGNEIESFSVSVGKNNDFGYVTGGGNYVPGNFAKVTAYPISGSEFEGWFVNGELVSSDEEFRFEVSEDTYIEARFTETELYDIKFAVSGKGTVLNVNNSYSKGSEVQLSAIPKEGYVFVGWKATSGKIIGAENPEATFVVGESSATVTAVFKENKKAEVCPECGKELQEGRNHKAGCGIADHFTCDGKDHSSCNNNNNAPVVPSNPGSSSGSSSDSSSDTSSGGGASVPEVSVTYCGNCGRELGEGESHDAPCGMPKHYTCDGNDHSYCGSSSEGDSSGSDSSEEVFYPEIVCKVCGQSYPSNESHICP
ncbi:MAG: InlB B-repeat-containing protein, partial [Oscillospiraceae bacterium]|nr:InlB B-repeat-containing protein [Oscillospiraceae bacterium]